MTLLGVSGALPRIRPADASQPMTVLGDLPFILPFIQAAFKFMTAVL